MVNQKKRDSDVDGILVGCGVFTLALLIVDLTYSKMNELLDSWVAIPFYIFHVATAILWVIVIAKISDPNYDKFRKYLIASSIIALLFVIGHRSDFIGDKMFKDDVNKLKQEKLEHAE